MAGTERIKTRAEEALAGHFASLPADDPMRDIRADAFAAFAQKGLPHRRIEDWKYTDLRALMSDVPAPATPAAAETAARAMARADVFDGIERDRIVFVNGHFVPALSETAGFGDAVEFASLGRFLADGGAILDRYVPTVDIPLQRNSDRFRRPMPLSSRLKETGHGTPSRRHSGR